MVKIEVYKQIGNSKQELLDKTYSNNKSLEQSTLNSLLGSIKKELNISNFNDLIIRISHTS